MRLDEPAPDFELPDLKGTLHKLSDYRGKIVILNFWSAECPHSERTDRYFLELLESWRGEVLMLPVSSNRNEAIQQVDETARARHLHLVLIDSESSVANLYDAQTTPHAFVVDREGILRYRGAVDDITFRRRQASCFYVRDVVEALLEGRQPELNETPAYGCAIVREI